MGPLPGTKKDAKQAGREFCEAAGYPPDNRKVDLQAMYRGELVRGYWQDPGQVRWHAAKTAGLDTRVICGPAAQVWYGANWIFSRRPDDAEVHSRAIRKLITAGSSAEKRCWRGR